MEIAKAPAILDVISTRKDGSLKIVFESNEVSEEQWANFGALRNQFGILLFIPPEKREVEIPEAKKDPNPYAKTPSQRLRAIIHIYWKSVGGTGDFENFYKLQMERIIDRFKEMLGKDDAPEAENS